ncbi:MAG TPA: glycosyltransferase family 39 protein [Armatimonadota bacterium]
MFVKTQRDEESRTHDRANANAKRVVMTLILALVLPVLIVWAVYVRQFAQITDMDAMDMAQVARNVQSGNGFVTSVIRPLATTRATGVTTAAGGLKTVRMQDMVHPPLFIYAEALVLATGASDNKVFLVSALFFLLTIPVLYALSKEMFNAKVGQLTVFAYVTSLFMTNMILTTGSATMAAFMFTLLCLMILRFAQAAQPDGGVPSTRSVVVKAALCGVVFALCYLTDYMLLLALLPVAVCVYVAGKREGKAGLVVFLLAFLVVAGPWMIRNTSVTGSPFFGLRALEIGMGTKAHPAFSLYRSTVPQTVLGLVQETSGDLGRKVVQGIQVSYGTLPVLGQPYLVAFFIVGLFYSFRRNGVNALRGMLIGSVICVAMLGNLFMFQMGTLTAFAPIMLAFAAAFFVRLLTDSKAPNVIVAGVNVLAGVLMVIPLAAALAVPAPRISSTHEAETTVGRIVAPNSPIVSDRAFEMAWYAGRTSVWIPNADKDFENLDGLYGLKALYLSAALFPSNRTSENYDIWREMYGQILPPAMHDQFARFDAGPYTGFGLFRGLDEKESGAILSQRALLLLREGAAR